ncbi:hypothetical protein D2U88_17245 [Flagellimonas aequoris]|uniref:Uncharacterized protein n=1 Tax=Flagellimonas aequoris TaxID=2306997 RepID=A0A418N4V1_9FLAO|nr:hypothetical protein D2U88_17245 [Allomuricauda aequoris]
MPLFLHSSIENGHPSILVMKPIDLGYFPSQLVKFFLSPIKIRQPIHGQKCCKVLFHMYLRVKVSSSNTSREKGLIIRKIPFVWQDIDKIF